MKEALPDHYGVGGEPWLLRSVGCCRGKQIAGFSPGDIAIFARTDSLLKERAEDALELCGRPWLYLDDNATADDDRVALGSMHRAKGLEFKAVVVVGCDADALPLSFVLRAMSDDGDRAAFVDQERQLLYVACTRARDRLVVTYAGRASEFLTAMETRRET